MGEQLHTLFYVDVNTHPYPNIDAGLANILVREVQDIDSRYG